MALAVGFCPYCAHQNPSDYKFCEACRKPLPTRESLIKAKPDLAEDEPVGTPGDPTSVPPRPTPEPVETPGPKGTRWVIAILAIAIAAIVVLAGVVVLERELPSTGRPKTTTTTYTAVDLCTNTTSDNCKGSQVQLPYVYGSESENVSKCDAITPQILGSQLAFNYTTSAGTFGAVIPQAAYGATFTGFETQPWAFYNSSTDLNSAAWHSGSITGTNTVRFPLPSSSQTWCLVWWQAGPSTVISLDSDVTLLVPQGGTPAAVVTSHH